MILNLIVIAFILAMAVMWSTYGLFSSLLHLLAVIVSGAIAFAFWEIWVDKLLIGFMPTYAWGVGLVLPFGVCLLVIRAAMDSLIRGNMQFPRLANQAVGGIFGAISGILTAGIAVIGSGFLPLPHDIGGFRPYEVDSVGQVVPVEGGGLWISVDSIAANFYNRLSTGAFSTSTPLAYYLPDAAKAGVVHRLATFYDPNQSLVISPDTVSIKQQGVIVADDERIPGVGSDVNEFLTSQRNRVGGGKLVLVQTAWTKGQDKATFDADILRVPPTQVRLSVNPGGGRWDLVAPIGFSRVNNAGQMEFYRLDNNNMIASSLFPEIDLNWVFAIPANAQPNFLLVRNTRLTWPSDAVVSAEGGDLGRMIGRMFEPADGEAQGVAPPSNAGGGGGENAIDTVPEGYATHRIARLEQTNMLPTKVSKNLARGFNKSEEDGDSEIYSGSDFVQKGTGGKGNSINRIAVSESLRPLRAVIAPHTPSNDGTPSGNVQEIWFSDAAGRAYRPFAFVLVKSDGRQKINVLASGDFRNNTDLPINEISDGDTLYAYFRIPPGVTLDAYHVGTARQAIDYAVK